ncbi:MAG: FAD-dependent oxidoreductase [Gemmatimonadota bacterium]
MTTRILILGTGHAHLYLLEALARTPLPGIEVTLVATSRDKVYAPMLPGVVAGHYREDEAVIDLVRLSDAAGARFVHEEAVAIDPDHRSVRLSGGSELSYEIASIGVGAPARDQNIAGVREYGHQVHGLPQLRSALGELDRVMAATPVEAPRIVVVGDGLWGAELALALRHRMDRGQRGQGIVTLVHPGPYLGGGRNGTHESLSRTLRAEDVTLMLGAIIGQVQEHQIQLSNGARVPFDLLVWATEPEAPAIQQGSGLPADGRGFLLVDDYLRSSGARNVFVSGGAAAHQGTAIMPVAGAPRLSEGPVLSANVLAAAAGQDLKQRFHAGKPARIATGLGATRSSWIARWASRRLDSQHRTLVRRFQEIRRGPK